MNRNFKGIWIPAHIWLDKNINLTEKCLLAEIDSLSDIDGCFASNQYFADFFGLSKDRISKLISGLRKKGYITVELIYKEGTCEVDKRIIKANTYGYSYLGGSTHLEGGGENNDYITNNYNINNNNNKTSKKKATKEVRHKYGEFKNVLLSDKDLEKLKAEYGEELVEKYIKKMDEWIELNGRRYKNYYLALRQWMNKEVSKKQEKVEKQEGDTKYDEEYFTKLMEETLRGGNKF